jgi:hypothetical protein
MEAAAPVVFVLVFVAIMGLIGWLFVRSVRRNRAPRDPAIGQDLARLAAAKGWRYSPHDGEFLRRFKGYPFGRGGRTLPALDLVTGTHRGRTFACFLYRPPRRTVPSEYPLELRHVRVVAVSLPVSPPVSVPTVLVTRGRTAPRWTRRYTVGDDAFDRAFAVGTEDERFAGRLLGQPVRRWLLDNPPAGSLKFGGADLVEWREDRGGFQASSIEPTLDRLHALLDRIPADALR